MHKVIGICSGYFNPIHAGHIEYLNEAKKHCDVLVVIINNDRQVELKMSKTFMDEKHRDKIVASIKPVDYTIISIDKTLDVSFTISEIYKRFKDKDTNFIFFNSGDRTTNNSNIREEITCDSLNIEKKFLPLPKLYSSSQLKGV